MSFSLARLPGESEMKYIYRLGSAKNDGLIDMTWEDLAEIMNRELRDDPSEYYSESAYRKKYALMRQTREEFAGSVDTSAEELKQLRDEIQKEKRKLFDQRREYNKLLTSDARAEHLTECLIEAAEKINQDYPMLCVTEASPFDDNGVDKEAIICFSDWHYGLVTDNIWNKYDTNICRQRVEKCVAYIKQYLRTHDVETVHICLLGDAAHGAIHSSCRVQSEEDTCDQLMHVAEILAQAIAEIYEVAPYINIYSNYGNHLRTVQKKEDSIYTDNMEKIIPWWLEQRFKDYLTISVVYSNYREFTPFKVFNYNICCVHGDLFNFKDIGLTANTVFEKLLGHGVDYTISGDKHHLEEFGQYGIESILVRSLCGTDDYAANKHLYDKPGQTMIIFNKEYGRECTYHIPLW